jgi:glycine betaine/proline transport system permease protein
LALPWTGVAALLGLAGYQIGGRWLGVLVAGLTAFCALSGFWSFMVLTVYICGVSSVIVCLIGMPLGVLAARSELANRILTIVVDTLQTIPLFVFLIPAVMFLRVGDVAAMLGIILYAVTPAIRYTNFGLRQVAPGLLEAANMAGCTRRQLLWRVQIPLALPEIMLGVNQVLMFAVAMDIIAAMIGTSDLGQEIFTALAKADSGRGIVAGLCTAFIGIVADRLISAWSRRVKERFGLA